MMKVLLEKAARLADQAELHETRSLQQSVTFQASKLKEITQSEEQVRTLRLIKDGKLGSAQSSKPESDETLLTYAANAVQFGSPVKYSWQAGAPVAKLPLFDKRVEDISMREMLDIASELVQAINSFDPQILAMAGVSKAVTTTMLANSAGFSGQEERTEWSVFLGGEVVDDSGFLFTYDHFSGTDLNTETAAIKNKIIESFRLARNNVTLSAGEYPVIFTPGGANCIIDPLLACLNGKAVAQGVSPFKGRLGSQVVDARISLRDDAHTPRASGSHAFDREGIATRPHNLIEAGKVNSFLLDLQSAAELGMQPTGNGGTNGPSPSNVVLSPGDVPFAEMMQDIEEGVLIDMTMGAWAGNPYGGQVSGNISLGYKIEKGKLVGRIKDCMFSVNVFEALLNQLHSLSREQVWKGNFCFPYVRLNDVNISTKS